MEEREKQAALHAQRKGCQSMQRTPWQPEALSLVALTAAAAPLMLEHSGGGSIINVTSTMSRVAGRGFAAYGTAKAALAHYTRLSALDLAPRIRVNAIAPGSILTSALDIVASNEELRTPMEQATPLRRLGDPLDIAAAAVYLGRSLAAMPAAETPQWDPQVGASSSSVRVDYH